MRCSTIVIALVGGLASLVNHATALRHHDVHSGETDLLGRSEHSLEARVDKTYWNDMLARACTLLAAMVNKDQPESIWTDPADLVNWEYGEDDEAERAWEWPGMAPMMDEAHQAYGWDTKKAFEKGKNFCSGVKHETETKHDGTTYPVTHWRALPNHPYVEQGLITGWYKFGAGYSASRHSPPTTTIPKLKNWSDIVFLQYKKLATDLAAQGRARIPLQAIFSAGIVNRSTQTLIGAVLVPADQRDSAPVFDVRDSCKTIQWDKRKYFDMDSEEGRVLLASENGRGAALLLLQHKGWFGKTTSIAGVTMWCSERKGGLNFMFHVLNGA